MRRARGEVRCTSSLSMAHVARFLVVLLLLAKDKHVLGGGVLEGELVLCRERSDSAFSFEIGGGRGGRGGFGEVDLDLGISVEVLPIAMSRVSGAGAAEKRICKLVVNSHSPEHDALLGHG